MLDFILHTENNDAINILKDDHNTVKKLFDEFEKSDNLRSKKRIVAEALTELQIHAVIEEEIFYPALRPLLEKDIMNEANEEHHVAKLLIAELSQMDGSEEHYEAKFHVLSENIRHHVKEEENDMFPKARSTDVDMLALGDKMLARKKQLKANGIPKSAEDKLMARTGGVKADSPALAAISFEDKSKAKRATAKPKAKALRKSA